MKKWRGYMQCGHNFLERRPHSLTPVNGETRMCHVCKVKQPTTYVLVGVDTYDSAAT